MVFHPDRWRAAPRSRLVSAWGLSTLAIVGGCGGPAGRAASEPELDDPTRERERMVASQLETRGVTDPSVLAAMRRVPRHRFVPESARSEAYADRPLPIGYDQTISQPFVVASMTEAARLEPTDRVLEIGTGSGYQAAVLAELVAEIYTIEIVPELAERSTRLLADLGYDHVRVRAGDGYRGWPEHAPFDAIVVTAAPDHVPPALTEQLALGGRLVLPVGDRDQELLVIERTPEGFERQTLYPVRFVPMTGEALEREGAR